LDGESIRRAGAVSLFQVPGVESKRVANGWHPARLGFLGVTQCGWDTGLLSTACHQFETGRSVAPTQHDRRRAGVDALEFYDAPASKSRAFETFYSDRQLSTCSECQTTADKSCD